MADLGKNYTFARLLAKETEEMSVKKILTSCLLVLFAVCVVAQTDTISGRVHELEGVTVTENRRLHTVGSTAPMHLLDHHDMLTMGVTDMADALHRLPGITLRDYGGAGGMKTVSVRGFGAKHTGVSYDGVMISECQSGEIDLSRYSLDNVGHLTLVIGDNDDIFVPARQASVPAVLNIQTVANEWDSRLTAVMKCGSFGYASPFVHYRQKVSDRLAVSAAAGYTYAENDYPYEIRNVTQTVEDRRTNSRMNSGHGEVNLTWNANAFNRLSGKVYYYDNDRQLPGQVHYYTNLNGETLRDRNFLAQLQYLTHNRTGWSLKWHAKFNWTASVYKDALTPNAFNDASYWQRESYTSAAVLYTPDDCWSFDYSADYSYNNLNGSSGRTVVGRPFRHTVLQSATARYHTQRLTVTGRLLHSLYLNDTQEGASARNMRRLSPSLSLSYRLLPDRDLFVRASYKNIFRSPTFNESYYFHYGSTDLLPESTHQLNVGATCLHQTSDIRLQASLDLYLNKVSDMIVAVPYNMFVWTCTNVGKVSVLGADVTANCQWTVDPSHTLTLAGNYSYQQAENRTNAESPYYGNQIAYIPLHTGSLSLAWENPWVNLSLHGSGVSSRWANNQHYDGTEIDGYWDTGLTVWHTFRWKSQSLEARLDVKNLFDRQYEIVGFYPMPGRSWQVSVKYEM